MPHIKKSVKIIIGLTQIRVNYPLNYKRVQERLV